NDAMASARPTCGCAAATSPMGRSCGSDCSAGELATHLVLEQLKTRRTTRHTALAHDLDSGVPRDCPPGRRRLQQAANLRISTPDTQAYPFPQPRAGRASAYDPTSVRHMILWAPRPRAAVPERGTMRDPAWPHTAMVPGTKSYALTLRV